MNISKDNFYIFYMVYSTHQGSHRPFFMESASFFLKSNKLLLSGQSHSTFFEPTIYTEKFEHYICVEVVMDHSNCSYYCISHTLYFCNHFSITYAPVMLMYPLAAPGGPILAIKVVLPTAIILRFLNALHDPHIRAEQSLELFLPRWRGGSPTMKEIKEDENKERGREGGGGRRVSVY